MIILFLILGWIFLIIGAVCMDRDNVKNIKIFIFCSLISIICFSIASFMGLKRIQQRMWDNPAPPIEDNRVERSLDAAQ